MPRPQKNEVPFPFLTPFWQCDAQGTASSTDAHGQCHSLHQLVEGHPTQCSAGRVTACSHAFLHQLWRRRRERPMSPRQGLATSWQVLPASSEGATAQAGSELREPPLQKRVMVLSAHSSSGEVQSQGGCRAGSFCPSPCAAAVLAAVSVASAGRCSLVSSALSCPTFTNTRWCLVPPFPSLRIFIEMIKKRNSHYFSLSFRDRLGCQDSQALLDHPDLP